MTAARQLSLLGRQRGTLEERWREFHEANPHVYAAFERPSADHTLERIDNDGNYEPGNCRWATMKEQCRNRRSSLRAEAFGETRTLAEWAERAGLPYHTVYQRVRRYGWPVEKALSIPHAGYGGGLSRAFMAQRFADEHPEHAEFFRTRGRKG